MFNRNKVEEKTLEYQDSSEILYLRIDFTDKECGKKQPIFSINKRMGLFEEIIRFEDIENRNTEINNQQEQLEEFQSEIAIKNEELEQSKQNILEFKQELEKRHNQIEQLTSELESKANIIRLSGEELESKVSDGDADARRKLIEKKIELIEKTRDYAEFSAAARATLKAYDYIPSAKEVLDMP